MDPKNKNVWITGASSGIGRAMAVAVARAGGHVLLSARRRGLLEDTAAACRAHGVRADVLPLDLADAAALPGHASSAAAALGSVDILMNVAGVGMRGLALDTEPAVARRVMDVDFWGTVELTRAVAPDMVRRGAGQIVVFTSLLGKFGAPRRSFYAAAKHAVHGWCDSLREELAGTGVEVTLIVPGWVRTEISRSALEADGSRHAVTDPGQLKGITPEECAARALRAIRKGAAEQLVGGYECASAYLSRLSPALLRRLLRRLGIG